MNSWERNSEGLGPMHSKSKTHGKNQAFCWLHNDIHLTNVTQSSNYVQSKKTELTVFKNHRKKSQSTLRAERATFTL